MVFLAAFFALVFMVLAAVFIFSGRISISDSSFPSIPSATPSICSLFADNSEGSGWRDGDIMEADKLTCCVRGAQKIKIKRVRNADK